MRLVLLCLSLEFRAWLRSLFPKRKTYNECYLDRLDQVRIRWGQPPMTAAEREESIALLKSLS